MLGINNNNNRSGISGHDNDMGIFSRNSTTGNAVSGRPQNQNSVGRNIFKQNSGTYVGVGDMVEGNDMLFINGQPSTMCTLSSSTMGGVGSGGSGNCGGGGGYGNVGGALRFHRPQLSSPVSSVSSSSCKRNNFMLWVVTPVAASFAVAIVIASLAGPQWLLTEEKLPNVKYNGSINFNAADDGIYITKHTKSSLWILCASQEDVDYYYCSTIDYFPNEEYSPDPNDSTNAIPYTITRATPFFLVSGIVLLISYFVLMIAMCSHQHSVYFFTSGILFIISGLVMLIGLIMYISIFKAEIGSKLRPKSPLQPPLFTFRYGQSFFLYVIGFISTEFVGLLNVFLFISLQQMGREKTFPCFMYTRQFKDLDTNFKTIQNSAVGGVGGGGCGVGGAVGGGISEGYGGSGATGAAVSTIGCSTSTTVETPYNCRKHPDLPNGYYSPLTHRRYFFEKPQNCDLHKKNLAKSLNELDISSTTAGISDTTTSGACKTSTMATNQPITSTRQQTMSTFDLPQEFPLTRSVSTTTDIYSSNNNNAAKSCLTRSSSSQLNNKKHKQHHQQPNLIGSSSNVDSSSGLNINMCGLTTTKNLTKNTNHHPQVTKTKTTSTASLSSSITRNRKRSKSKDELFMEFCERAGTRPKPKDIYLIEDDIINQTAELDRSIYVVDSNRTLHGQQNDTDSRMRGFSDDYYNNYRKSIRRNSCATLLNYPRSTAGASSNLCNSNSSLNKSYPKSLFDLVDTSAGDRIFLNNRINSQYFDLDGSSSSQYGSRTLPRNFLKRNIPSIFATDENGNGDGISGCGVSGSSDMLHGRLSQSRSDPYHLVSNFDNFDTTLYRSVGRGRDSSPSSSRDFYRKPYDTFVSRNSRQRDAVSSVNWPNEIYASTTIHQQHQQQQSQPQQHRSPTAGRSQYQHQLYPAQQDFLPPLVTSYHLPHGTSVGIGEGVGVSGFPSIPSSSSEHQYHQHQQHHHNHRQQFNYGNSHKSSPLQQHQQQQQQKQQQQHIQDHDNFNKHQLSDISPNESDDCTGDNSATFDLDKMENERRKSHASLFERSLGYDTGTPV